jgi:hypothetical protein
MDTILRLKQVIYWPNFVVKASLYVYMGWKTIEYLNRVGTIIHKEIGVLGDQ